MDMAELIRSLGGMVSIRTPYTTRIGTPFWLMDVRTPFSPFYLSRKTRRWAPSPSVNTIVSIEPVGEKVCQCLHLTSKRHLYITDDYIVTHNTMLSVMQLVANSSALLDRSDKKAFLSKSLSAKEEILLDLLDGDLQGEHVLCFTKYRSWIDRLEYLTTNRAFTNRKFLRITGAETGKQRENNRLLFQDHPDYNFLMLNGAGIEGSNLQQAAHLICLDLPWSWGDFIQLVGRMVRMASPHSACTLHILFTLGTVDEYVIEVQKSKKGVFERILGNAGTAGILEEDLSQDLDILATGLEDESDDDFRDMLKAHAKTLKLRDYTSGVMLAKQVGGLRDYDPLAKKRKVTEEELDLKW